MSKPSAFTMTKLNQIAARWFIRMQEMDEESPERTQFEQWLLQSEKHQTEYARIADAWGGIDSIDDLKKMAYTRQSEGFLDQSTRGKKIKNVIAALCLGGVFILAGLMGQRQYDRWLNTPTMQVVSVTKPTEISTRVLDDGSQITMNGNSKVQVTYYPKRRHVALLQGEAIFEVTKNPERPFVVDTNTARVTVLGTRFSINKLSKLVRVSVDHGSVKIESFAPANTIVLHNGEVAQVSSGKGPELLPFDAKDYFKFANGIVVFNQADIYEIADELARYTDELVLAKGNSTDKISAIINIKDLNTFYKTLPKISNVHVSHTRGSTVLQATK